MRRLVALVVALSAGAFALPDQARAFDLFQRPNPEVEAGNEHLRENRPAQARAAYDRAARQLPDAPGVALDRGLALLAEGKLDEALEAFLRAAEPPAPAELRADAYYDRGIALMRQAEAHAEQDAHEPAQDRFRLAAESFRRSLAARPGNRDAAWNLELALRRLHEEQEEQEQQQQDPQQNQQDQQQNQQDPQQNQQDPQQNQQDPQDQQQDQRQGQQDQPQGQQDQPQGQQDPRQGQQDQPQGQQDQPQGQQDQPQGQQDPQHAEQDPQRQQQLPSEAARILDSLQDGEENLERIRARARAMRERRLPTKDW